MSIKRWVSVSVVELALSWSATIRIPGLVYVNVTTLIMPSFASDMMPKRFLKICKFYKIGKR